MIPFLPIIIAGYTLFRHLFFKTLCLIILCKTIVLYTRNRIIVMSKRMTHVLTQLLTKQKKKKEIER